MVSLQLKVKEKHMMIPSCICAHALCYSYIVNLENGLAILDFRREF